MKKKFSIYTTAICLIASPANASIESGSITSQYSLGSHANSIYLIDGGTVNVSDSPAVIGTGNHASPSANDFNVGVNVNDIEKGISSNQEAVKVTDDLITLRVAESLGTAGTITSSISGTSSGTISVIDSKQGTNQIVIGSSFSSNAILSNTATSGVAINFNNSTSHYDAFNVSNFGTISANNNANSYGIKFYSAETGSILHLNNYGTLSAGALGHAIAVESNNKAFITNTGTITGSINLGTNSNSYINITDGTINGDITLGNNSQTLNIDGTSTSAEVNGNISGSGIITLDSALVHGNISLNNGSVLNLNAGSWTGNSADNYIDGSAANRGTVNTSNGIVVINSSIGKINAVENFNIGANSNTIVAGNINAQNISLGGILRLDNDSGALIKGDLTGNGSGTINLRGVSHTLDSGHNLTLVSGDTIISEISSTTGRTGNIIANAGSVVSNSANTKISIYIPTGTTSIAVGNRYAILSTDDGSNLNKISDSNITIQGATSNHVGKYAFTSAVMSNDLVLNVERYRITTLANSHHGNVYNNINGLSSTNGTLGTLSDYLDSDSYSNSQKETALKSANSQVDNSANRLSFNNVNASANLISGRLNNLRLGSAGKASGDKPLQHSFWAEAFGSKTSQGDISGGDGYKASSGGFAIGLDKKIDRELTLGVAAIYSGSSVKSNDQTKRTSISNYQINLYSGHNFEKFFINNVIGFGINQYDSNRTIAVAGASAHAKYSGQTYLARSEIGTNKKLQNDFIFTPSFMITAARNTVGSFSETGADTLNLHVKNGSTNFLEGRIGATLSKNYKYSKTEILTPSILASYGYDFIGSSQRSTANFIGQTTSFSSNGAKIAQGSLKLGAGLKFFSSDSFSLSTDYNFEHRTKYSSHTGFIRGKYNF